MAKKKTDEKEVFETRLAKLNDLRTCIKPIKKGKKILAGKAEPEVDDIEATIKILKAYGNRLGRAIARNETTLENVED
jgi:hypothetical protein